MAAMLLHLGIELFSNVKKFPLLYKEKLRQLGERKYIGFNSITLIELHIHFELRISDYAVIGNVCDYAVSGMLQSEFQS